MSVAMSEHEPILVAPRKTVEGTSGSSGTSSVVADELTGSQHEQSLCSQKGVSLSLSAVMRSRRAAQRVVELTVSSASLVHTHVAADATGKSSSSSHGKLVPP